MKHISCSTDKRIVLAFLILISSHHAYAQQQGDDGVSAQEEQRMREAGRNLPPEKLERLISEIKTRRQQAGVYRSNPDKARKELLSIVARMKSENAKESAKEFAADRDRLGSKIYWFSQNHVPISADLGNEISEALIDIYEKRSLYSSAPDHLPITTAAEYGSSPRVKGYIEKILQGPTGPDRDQVLSSLSHTHNLRGDSDIFSALQKELPRNQGDADLPVLGAMKGVDSEKTLPFLLREVDSTTSVRRFIATSGALSRYGKPELLEHVLRRIKDFPKRSWGDPQNATLGIDDDSLLTFITNNEDEKLELALAALNQDVTALNKCPAALLDKLDKGTPRSRRAVAHFLEQTSGLEPFKKPKVVQALADRANKESDPDAKAALGAALERVRGAPKGGGHE